MKFARWIYMFVLAGFLSACGQSGPLYLPEGETSNIRTVHHDPNANVQPP